MGTRHRGEGPNMLTSETLTFETIVLRYEEPTLIPSSHVRLPEERGFDERAIQKKPK